MRIYNSPSNECVDASYTKHAIELSFPVKDSNRQGDRLRRDLWDVLLIFFLGVGFFLYCAKPIASPSSNDILARLEEDEIELSWANQHIGELNDNVADILNDYANKGAMLEEEQVKRLELEQELKQKEEEYEELKHKIEEFNEDHDRMGATWLEPKQSLRGETANFQFQLNDMVEVFEYTSKSWNLFKIKRRGMMSGKTPIYSLVRIYDGKVFAIVPGEFLRQFEPQAEGTETLCNMGGHREPNFVDCVIVAYTPRVLSTSNGVENLEGLYDVRLRGHQGLGDVEATLLVRMVKRPADDGE